MDIRNYDFRLPDALIAQTPSIPRDECRLMVLDRTMKVFKHDTFRHIGDYLRPGDVLVFNQSKVIPARILFEIEGKQCEILLIKKSGEGVWICMVKPGRFFREGALFSIHARVRAKVERVTADGFRIIRFEMNDEKFREFLDGAGSMPLPPYIKDNKVFFNDYQTVYAREEGSVAAPTAGLHFTERLLDKLRNQGVQLEFITLHVGPGTFLPVKVNDIRRHTMHHENFEVDFFTAKRLTDAKNENRRILAVGTTAVRVLESCYDPKKGFTHGKSKTDIFIREGHHWKCVDGLITNFHLPKSTLLVLVSAFAGRKFVRKAYREAIEKRYRFYSFGDAMFIF